MCVSEIITEFERCFAFSHLGLDNKKSQQKTTEHNKTQQNILLYTGLSVEGVFFIYASAIMKICWAPCFLPQKYENRDYSCWFQSSKQHQKLLEWECDIPLQQSLLLNIKICLLFFKQQCLFFKNNLYFQKSARLWWWSSLSAYLTRGLHPSKWDHRCYNKLHKQQAVIQLNSDHCQWNGNQKRPLSKNFFISLTIT